MSGREILLDTNILLYFLTGNPQVRTFFFDYDPVISFITELEVLSMPGLYEAQRANIQDLLSNVKILPYSESYKPHILNIRSAKLLKLPDAIIAGTALSSGLLLVSADSAFKKIPELNFFFYDLGNE